MTDRTGAGGRVGRRAEAGFDPGDERLDGGREDDDVLFAQRRVVGEQVQDRVAQHLDLTRRAVTRVGLDRVVVRTRARSRPPAPRRPGDRPGPAPGASPPQPGRAVRRPGGAGPASRVPRRTSGAPSAPGTAAPTSAAAGGGRRRRTRRRCGGGRPRPDGRGQRPAPGTPPPARDRGGRGGAHDGRRARRRGRGTVRRWGG